MLEEKPLILLLLNVLYGPSSTVIFNRIVSEQRAHENQKSMRVTLKNDSKMKKRRIFCLFLYLSSSLHQNRETLTTKPE